MRLATGKKSMSSPPAHRTLVSLAQLNPLLPPQGQIKELEYTTPGTRACTIAPCVRVSMHTRASSPVYVRAHRGICVYMDGRVLEKRPPRLPKATEYGKETVYERRREIERTLARIDRRIWYIHRWRQEELERQGELYAIGQPAHFLSAAGRTRDEK